MSETEPSLESLRAEGVQHLYDELSEAGVTLHDGGLSLPPQGRVWLV